MDADTESSFSFPFFFYFKTMGWGFESSQKTTVGPDPYPYSSVFFFTQKKNIYNFITNNPNLNSLGFHALTSEF